MATKNSWAMLMLAVVTAVSLTTAVSAQAASKTNVHDHRTKTPSKTNIHDHRTKAPSKSNIHDHRTKTPSKVNIHDHRTKKPGGIRVHDHRTKKPGGIRVHDHRTKVPGGNRIPPRRPRPTNNRFDVKIELLRFKSLMAADAPLDFPNVNYSYTLNADIVGVSRQTIVRGEEVGRPMRYLNMSRTIRFRIIRTPHRARSLINFSANVTARYKNRIADRYKTEVMGKASGNTSLDLFRMANQSKDGKAVQTVLVRNRNYLMILRVTVTEID